MEPSFVIGEKWENNPKISECQLEHGESVVKIDVFM